MQHTSVNGTVPHGPRSIDLDEATKLYTRIDTLEEQLARLRLDLKAFTGKSFSANRILAIQRAVAEVFTSDNVTTKDLCSKKRPRTLACARHMAMKLCYEYKLGSSTMIGEEFGGFDHGSVLYACDSVSSWITNPYYAKKWQECREAAAKFFPKEKPPLDDWSI